MVAQQGGSLLSNAVVGRRSATTPITSRQLPIDMRRTHGGYGVRKSGPRNDKPTLYAFFLCRQ